MGCYHSSELREFEQFKRKLNQNNSSMKIIAEMESEMKKNNDVRNVYEKCLQTKVNDTKNIIYSLH